MRRPTLSTKLFTAALPLVVAIVALLALTVRGDLNDVQRAESGAELGAVWNPLITALTAIEAEVGQAIDPDSGSVPVTGARRATDQAVNDLREDIDSLGASEAAGAHVTAGRSALSAARRNLDMLAIDAAVITDTDPFEAYELASRELVAVGQLLPSEAGDPELGRQLLAVVKLAEAKLSANAVIAGTQQWAADPTDIAPLLTARSAFSEMEATLGEFEAIATDEWAAQYRQGGFTTQLSQYRADLDRAVRAAEAGQPASFDTESFRGLVANGVQFQSAISQEIVDAASLEANDVRSASLIRIAISLGAVLLAALIALFITRSITRRIKAVSNSANQVASDQLPALVEALRDPRGKTTLPDVHPVNAKGNDELAELAGAFNSMQNTLVDVAHEQVEVLRRGVSDIFVTMARRNRSLIDRQLAMLDEYEAEVDDPSVLSNYYQLDHLATRMRRNSESLLVLASAEPKRRRVKATEIDDVVRASIGEVEDYRRVDIEHLETLQVRGNVVADVSHLIAELLDNATAFSPPESPVRVGGRRAGDAYLLRIVDSGIGIGTERLQELNELLREPPIVGLSVESTLGMSVVSLLANKHGIGVTLSAGNPGLTVDISLPSTLFGPIDDPSAQPMDMSVPAATMTPSDETIVAWNDDDPSGLSGLTIDEAFQPAAESEQTEPEYAGPEPTPSPVGIEDEQPVTSSDWTKMSLSLSAFQSGQQSAANTAAEPVAETFEQTSPVTEPVAETFEQTEPVTEPAAETFEQTEPAAEPVADTFQPAEPVAETFEQTEPITEPVADTFQPAEPVAETFEQTEPITEPVADTFQPAEPVAETFEQTEPITEPVADTFQPAEPVAETFEQTEPITEPVADTFQPAEPVAESFEQTEPVTEPVADTFQPAEPVAESFEQTEPITEPVADTFQPAEPVAESFEQTEPITEPVADTFQPAEPVAESFEQTSPVTEPVADTFQPAEPVAESFEQTSPVTEPVADTFEQTSPVTEPVAESFEQTEPITEPVAETFEQTSPVTEPVADTFQPAGASSITELANLVAAESLASAEPGDFPQDVPDLPPPPLNLRSPGEFDMPLAPPITADGPSRGPVTPESARSAAVRPAHEAEPAMPNLPTRSPGTGPDGPDRLLDVGTGDAGSDPGVAPSALQSALSAFDGGRNGTTGPNGSLPTRTRVGEPVEQIETPMSTAPSRLDPDALRDRLRAFQTEFRSDDDDQTPGDPTPGTDNDHNSDLGGDLR